MTNAIQKGDCILATAQFCRKPMQIKAIERNSATNSKNNVLISIALDVFLPCFQLVAGNYAQNHGRISHGKPASMVKTPKIRK